MSPSIPGQLLVIIQSPPPHTHTTETNQNGATRVENPASLSVLFEFKYMLACDKLAITVSINKDMAPE